MTILLGPSRITDPARLLTDWVPHSHYIKCAGHLFTPLNLSTRRDLITRIVAALSRHDFDAIACRGLSGMLVAPIVAMEMDKTLLIVRKDEDDSHSWRNVEGDHAARRYVILDDFVAMGGTIRAIHKHIKAEVPAAQCIGVLEYHHMFNNCGDDLTYNHGELDAWFDAEVAKEKAKIELETARRLVKIVAPEPPTVQVPEGVTYFRIVNGVPVIC